MNDECPACGGKSFYLEMAYPAPTGQASLLGISDIYGCHACGLHFAAPLPQQSAVDGFYASGAYWDELAPPSRAQGDHAYSQSIQRCLWIVHHADLVPNQVADVGAGQGWMGLALNKVFGSKLQRYDFFEPDGKAASTILRRKLHCQVRQIETLSSQSNYDLIFLNQVLEHTVTPAALLTNLGSALKPGGYLYVETPNRDERFKANVFPHLLFWDVASLDAQVRAIGLQVIAIEAFGSIPRMADIRKRVLQLAFKLTSALRIGGLARSIDKRLWNYCPSEDGIWVRALLRKAVDA